MKTEKGEFSLGKIEFKPKEIVDIKWGFIPKVGVASKQNTGKFEHYPHPNLKMHFEDELKNNVIKVMGYARVFQFKNSNKIGEDERKAFDKLNVFEKEYMDALRRTIKVVALEAKGGETTTSIIIHYRYNPYSTTNHVSRKTPSINLDTEVYGIEAELADVYSDVESEAYQYIYENKSGEVPMNLNFGEE